MMQINPLFFKASPQEQAWIMSATRGPDDQDKYGPEKAKYTTPIRCWLWQVSPTELHYMFGNSIGSPIPNNWGSLHKEVIELHSKGHTHFVSHLDVAIRTITRLEGGMYSV